MRAELRKLGVDASFFHSIVTSGAHLESIKLVLNGSVDATCVDSSALSLWMADNPQMAADLHVMCSWGPYPIQPIVLNSRLPDQTKKRIATALQAAHDHSEFGEKFLKYGVEGFGTVDPLFYKLTKETMEMGNDK